MFIKKMAQIPRNMQTMQYIQKEKGFQIIKSTINNTCHYRKNAITYFGHAKNYVGQVRIIDYLTCMAS